MTELKPCPFCPDGGIASLCYGTNAHGKSIFGVECCRCGASSNWYYSEEDAIEAWNTRYVDATQHTHCCPCGAERTCRNAWQYGGDVFQCSECGCQLALDDGYGNTIEFSDVPKQSYPNNPMHCVGCGARVEGD